MISKILTTSFYILFFFTPLFWSPNNFELFEYNKMMLVYGLTLIITATWLLKMIQSKTLLLKRTPLDIPILLFLAANILSTIFSIDPHTSIWGYYSRSNGGLLSLISYFLLYYALVSNFEAPQAIKFLKSALLGGLLVSLWAIPEHFGVSPSCVILTHEFNASCWVQDVQARVFATLGQPNWLAAYLAMLIFPAIYFALTAKNTLSRTTYYILLTTYYLAFAFTYSRGATLGLIGGLIFFLSFAAANQSSLNLLNRFWSRRSASPQNDTTLRKFIIILSIFICINLFFGSALTNFKLLSKFASTARPSVTSTITTPKPSGTQLESGGTESGQIRLIVWKGALDIFQHYPILGSGVETFAYAYYNFRPAEHNVVSEWDFLYNKAHNEFLNYLATTGIVGFISYMAIIITFIIWSIKKILEPSNNLLDSRLLVLVTLASYFSYLIQNFFSFSVVIIALFFYLFPAIAFIATDSTKPLKLPELFLNLNSKFLTLFYRRPFYTKLTKIAIIVIFGTLIFKLINYYIADTYFAQGIHYNEAGNPGRAYNNLVTAVSLNPKEPYYHSELGYAAAGSAVALAEEDATLSAQLKNQAIVETVLASKISPKNISYLRTAVRTYFLLSSIDINYTDKTLQALNQAIALAPTDAKLVYNKALILDQEGKNSEAIEVIKTALQLKPNYQEALEKLAEWQKP